MTYAIGHLVYGHDATIEGWGASESAGQIRAALIEAINEAPHEFEVDPEEAKLIADPEEPQLEVLSEILTEVLCGWTSYRGNGPMPAAIGIAIGSFDECSNYPFSKILAESQVNEGIKEAYAAQVERLPESFRKRVKKLEPTVLVIWGSS